jgi:hypothetical protein
MLIFLTLVYSLVLWCNILLFNYSRFVILTNYKNQRITLNTNQFLNPYMQQHNTCNSLKKNLDYMELKKKTKYKIQCNMNVVFYRNPFVAPLMSFSSSRTIQRPNDHQLITLPHKSLLITHHEHEFKISTNSNHSTLCYEYVLQ